MNIENTLTADYLLNLPENKRKILVERIFLLIKEVASKQLELLENFRKGAYPKTQRHLYFFNIVKSFWKDADFCLALGKKKFRSYAVYPARTMMEKALKILWFTKQKLEEQDLITEKELLKQCFDFYQIDKEQEFKDHYNKINSGNFPDIDNIKRKDLQAFPTYEVLCNKSGLTDSSELYNSYRHLSGIPHGDLLSIFMIQDSKDEKIEYRRSLMIATRFAIEMIKVVDFHLENKTKKEVSDVIQKADKLRQGIKT